MRNQRCGCCNPKAQGNSRLRKNCIRCEGTGKIKDYHYFMIVGKNCFDMDTIK